MNELEFSVNHWLSGLKAGESVCAQVIYQGVYDRLLRLARRRFGGQAPRWADEEDVVLSAFHSFCRGIEQRRFPQIDNRDDLWKILTKITCRKTKDYNHWSKRQKRGDGFGRGESIFESQGNQFRDFGLADAAESSETPDIIVAVAAECERLLDLLGGDTLQQIAIWKLECDTDSRMAQCLGGGAGRRTEVRTDPLEMGQRS
jgi:hypothetical protein